MIKILKNQKGVNYVIMSKEELKEFSIVSNPKCDECFKVLTNKEEIIYIPSLNEAYCKECGIEKLKWCSSCENELDERYVENRMKQINEVFNVIDEDKDLLDLIKEDKQRIENRSGISHGYDLLNKLYNAVPESYRSKIDYGTDYEDNGDEKADKTIFFDDIALGKIDDIKDIGCWNGKICGRNDNETTEFDKFISIEELEKGKIYGRNENGQVIEVI